MIFLNNMYNSTAKLQIDIGNCRNGCIYCYRNFFITRQKQREDKLEVVKKLVEKIEQVDAQEETTTIKDYYIKKRYPIACSNISDLFGNDYLDYNLDVIKVLKDYGFNIFWETKGVKDEKQFKKFLDVLSKNESIYVTLTTFDDKKRKEIEPNAPSIEMRLFFIEELLKMNYRVQIAFNPALNGYFGIQELKDYLEKLKSNGLKLDALYIYNFHIPRRYKNSNLKLKKLDEKYKDEQGVLELTKYCNENKIYISSFLRSSNKIDGLTLKQYERLKYNKNYIIIHDLIDLLEKNYYEHYNSVPDTEKDEYLAFGKTRFVEYIDLCKKNNYDIDFIVDKADLSLYNMVLYHNLPKKIKFIKMLNLMWNDATNIFKFNFFNETRDKCIIKDEDGTYFKDENEDLYYFWALQPNLISFREEFVKKHNR